MRNEKRTENKEKLTGNNFVLCSLLFVLFSLVDKWRLLRYTYGEDVKT